MIDYSGHILMTTHPLRGYVNYLVINLLSSLTTDQADVTDDDNFYQVLASHVQISSNETSFNGQICSRKVVPIDPQTLATRWMISPECAKHTVVMTTQIGVQTCLNPTLSWQFLANDQMLRFKRVLHTMFSDTLFARSVSQQGNKNGPGICYILWLGTCSPHEAQRGYSWDSVPCLSAHWCTSNHGHQWLQRTDHRGVPMQTQGDWLPPTSNWTLFPLAASHWRLYLWTKRGSSQKMIKTGSPKCLWDHCFELEAYVCSCTSNEIYMTTGHVPEAIMTGNMANISHITEFGWYDWVMFCDNKPSYPDDKLILGRYLGPTMTLDWHWWPRSSNQMVCLSAGLPCNISLMRSSVALFTKKWDASLMSPSNIPWASSSAAGFPQWRLDPRPLRR